MKKEYITNSPQQTKSLGKKLAKRILKKELRKTAIIIGLQGELGGGKTTFLQGFAKGLGIKEKILSPTFVILKKFQVPNFQLMVDQPQPTAGQPQPTVGQPKVEKVEKAGKFQEFYHIDCYRIQKPKELLDLGFKEIISDPKNIIVIEWADRVKKIMPQDSIWIKFEFVNKNNRRITVR